MPFPSRCHSLLDAIPFFYLRPSRPPPALRIFSRRWMPILVGSIFDTVAVAILLVLNYVFLIFSSRHLPSLQDFPSIIGFWADACTVRNFWVRIISNCRWNVYILAPIPSQKWNKPIRVVRIPHRVLRLRSHPPDG
ncbi:hypothetical protein D9757_012981 [Collybiopsis confluens]|uniref:Uncharacterized protein n=1 Tax=Collybiopsis confluens TaxID=2823264 RepID=A0A8H5GI39_9AGAR|nr:hypothetical protein D9757_012981 [Collybiopsis confluens]